MGLLISNLRKGKDSGEKKTFSIDKPEEKNKHLSMMIQCYCDAEKRDSVVDFLEKKFLSLGNTTEC